MRRPPRLGRTSADRRGLGYATVDGVAADVAWCSGANLFECASGYQVVAAPEVGVFVTPAGVGVELTPWSVVWTGTYAELRATVAARVQAEVQAESQPQAAPPAEPEGAARAEGAAEAEVAAEVVVETFAQEAVEFAEALVEEVASAEFVG